MNIATINKYGIASVMTAFALAFGTGAIAQSISKTDYSSGKSMIAADYKAAKASCAALTANAKAVCLAEAKGKEKVAKAELEAAFKPNDKTRRAVSIAKSDADYAVAREKCNNKSGNDKKICLKTAKSAQANAKVNASVAAEMKREKVASTPAKEVSIAPAPRQEKAKETTAASVATTSAKAAAAEEPSRQLAQVSAESDKSNGKAVYEKSCKGCHTGMKPKFGDKEAWAPLIKQGAGALTASVIKGKGIMPPRGAAASDADVKAAVDYILSQSK